MVKGFQNPKDFFDQFKKEGQSALGSHREAGRYHVSILDDHDMVGRTDENGNETKRRFSANNDILNRYYQVAHAIGVQLTTLGIPCIYYGTEQAFDGKDSRHNADIEPLDDKGRIPYRDRYVRESMFGSGFGAFETEGCHFFDRSHPTYLRIAAIARVRNRTDPIGLALRRGRQYLRETSPDRKGDYAFPGAGDLVAWSRVLEDQEVLMVMNSNGMESNSAHIIVDASMHEPRPDGSMLQMTYLYRSDWNDDELSHPPQDQTVLVDHYREGNWKRSRATIHVTLPPAGMAILA